MFNTEKSEDKVNVKGFMETKPQTPNTLKTKSFREVGTPNRPESRI